MPHRPQSEDKRIGRRSRPQRTLIHVTSGACHLRVQTVALAQTELDSSQRRVDLRLIRRQYTANDGMQAGGWQCE
jgi:hypothetical protein